MIFNIPITKVEGGGSGGDMPLNYMIRSLDALTKLFTSSYVLDEEDYNFEWNYDFENKITFFHIPPLDNRPIFEICRTVHPDCQMGSPMIVPISKINIFYNIIKECYNSLLDIGLMDDDQLFLLLAYRKHSDIIQNKPSNWFLPIKDYGGEHFKLKPQKKESLISKIKRKVKKVFKIR